MPYPVSPPSPPPVVTVQEVNVQETEELRNATTNAIAAPTPHLSPEFATLPAIVGRSSSSSESASSDAQSTGALPSNQDGTVGAASTAESLGTPLELGVPFEVEDPLQIEVAVPQASSSTPERSPTRVHSIPHSTPDSTQDSAATDNPSASPVSGEAASTVFVNPSSALDPSATEPFPPSGFSLPDADFSSVSTIPSQRVPELVREWVYLAQMLPEGTPLPDGGLPPLPPLPPVPVPPAGDILIIPGQEDSVPESEEPPDAESPDGGQLPPIQPATQDILELTADRQEYDEVRQVFLAEGNVELRFQEAILTADRLQVNIPNRIAVADGDAVLTRGDQVLRGERITYNLTLDQGNIQQARGELFLPSLSEDTGPGLPTDISPERDATRPLSDRLASEQPLQVFGSPGGIIFGVDTPNQITGLPGSEGEITRLRYEADEIQFEGDRWQATNVRITNDPFSPPELELRSRFVTVMPISPFQTEIRARNPRLVFDQGLQLPLFRDRLVLDSRERDSGLVNFGFDERDRGGLFLERSFEFDLGRVALLTLTPQILVQRAIDEEGFFDPSSYGLIVRLDASPRRGTSLDGNLTLTSLDFGADDFEDTYRASIRANQEVLDHNLALEYSYRDRLFNGSLGFQNVQSSLGFVVTSPIVPLGDTGINLSYQGGVQFINSDINVARAFGPDFNSEDATELRELLPDPDPVTGIRPNNRINLTRYQASASLNRSFLLWSGTALPPTPDQGLRYTPNPVVPFVRLNVGLRGVVSAYSNGDTQSVLTSTVGLSGQFGNFSRPFLDYTGINISYSYNAVGGDTPFNFDRVNDIQVLSLGLVQQVYGPFRFGIRSNIFIESQANRENNTDTTFSLEYSRRTYSINLSYSPSREAGAINFRLNDFNWTGDPGRFSGLGGTVSGGVRVPGD